MTPASAADLRFDDPRPALQRRGAVEHQHGSARRLHSVSPEVSHASTDMRGDMGQSIGDRARTSGRSYEERLQTRTSLHVRLVQHVTEPSKVVAKKIGASADTVDLH